MPKPPPPPGPPPPRLRPDAVRIPGSYGLVVASWLVLLLDGRAVHLLSDAGGGGADAAFVLLIGFRVPLAVLAACVLVVSPGFYLAAALAPFAPLTLSVLRGFALSVVVNSALAATVQEITGSPLRGPAFVTALLACASVCAVGALVSLRTGRRRAGGGPTVRTSPGVALSIVAVPLVLLVLLAPQFFWENFNGDGIHAYEAMRLLLVGPLPFFPPDVEDLASFPGVSSMLFAYPGSWFLRIFGEVEAVSRLPLLLYLAVLFCGIVEVVRHGKASGPGRLRSVMIWAALSISTLVMATSATYAPYSADIAMPAAQDALMMACAVGFIAAFLSAEAGWMLLFLALTVTSLPSGFLIVGGWCLAVAIVWKPRPRRRILLSLAALGVFATLAGALPAVLSVLGHPAPGGEYSAMALLGRFRYLRWDVWQRVLYLVVPCGILPAAYLLAWKRQDRVGRAVTLLTAGLFGLFAVQAYSVLHHFYPVMVLPLLVFQRGAWTEEARSRRIVAAASGAAAILALWASLPASLEPDRSARIVGAAIEDRTEGYRSVSPAALGRALVLLNLFPPDWDETVPENSYGGSPHAWRYYAHRFEGADRDVNYVMLPPGQPPPAGMRLVAAGEDVALYVRSDAVWEAHRALRPPSPVGSPLYRIPRDVLFRRATEDRAVIDLRALVGI